MTLDAVDTAAMPAGRTVTIGGLPITVIDRAQAARQMVWLARQRRQRPLFFTSANGEVIARAAGDPAIAELFTAADQIVADGQPLVIASRLLCREALPERVATTDLFHDVAQLAEVDGVTFYFYGATAERNAAAVTAARTLYPQLRIVGASHGYLDGDALRAKLDEINTLGPDIVWLGLGVPREQMFFRAHADRLRNVGMVKTSGGLFDHMAGKVRRAPGLVQRLGFEWLWRMLMEPRRLGWRYLTTNPRAAWAILEEFAMSTIETDIAIVGGGLSGTIAAIVLGRAGYSVALVDRNQDFPDEFRVEKISGDQVTKMAGLGLLPIIVENGRPFDEIVNMRRGRVLDRKHDVSYGIFYKDLVTAMRRALPPSVQFVAGRVTDLATSADRQTVTVAEHGTIDARLVVLASGMSDILRSRVGIEREVLHEKQSLTFGFNMRPVGAEHFPFRAFTYYGERPADGIDYFHCFPAGDTIRANLFTFLDHRDPWVKAVRTDPHAALVSALPGLRKLIGDFEVVDKMQNWIMDLGVARNVRQPGIVLIGDAYQTSCPAAGTGVSRLLTDIRQLCAHVPGWLATPGMDAGKIAAFYDDPHKQAMDAHALAIADFRRNFTIDTRPAWHARRQTQYLRRAVMHRIENVSPGLAQGIRTLLRRA